MANFSSGMDIGSSTTESKSTDPFKSSLPTTDAVTGTSKFIDLDAESSDNSVKTVEEGMEVRERVDQGKDVDTLEDIYKDSDGVVEGEEEGRGFVGDVVEGLKPTNVVKAVAEGVATGIGEGAEAIGSLGNWIEDKTGLGRFVWTDGIIPEYWSNEKVRENNLKDSLISSVMLTSKKVTDAIPDADTVTGGLITGISQFTTGFIMTRRLTGVKGLKGNILNSAITDASFFDAYDENLSNMLKGQGAILDNVFTQSLMSDENDSEFKARLKKAGEGAIIGGPLEALGRVFRTAKAFENGKTELATTGKVSDATRKEMDNSIDALESIDINSGQKTSKETLKKNLDERNRKYDVNRIKGTTEIKRLEKKEAAAGVASDNRQVAKEVIESFEETLGADISTKDAKGNITGLDFQKARQVGKDKAYEKLIKSESTLLDNLSGFQEVNPMDVAAGVNKVYSAVLDPDKFNAVVAVASDLKKKFPEAFKTKKLLGQKGNYKIVDHLFELAVQIDPTTGKRVLETDELMDTLAKYGLGYEEYVTTIIGSASEAGRVLGKLSALGRGISKSEAQHLEHARTIQSQGSIRNAIMRIENIRRGMMVSQLATASRNLTSAYIRMPLESLGNVMDTALFNISKGNYGKAASSLIEKQNWIGSTRGTLQMFNPLVLKDMKGVTEIILKQPEMGLKFDEMFNQVSEIRRHTGAGRGGAFDKIATEIENGVDALNVFNRLQEYSVRRVSFITEMERLLKREWDIDLLDELNGGNIRDLIGDVSKLKPKGARSFMEITDSSVKKALDVTYAKQPDFFLFKQATDFITRNGLTAIVPFPRFMFNSIEIMAQYGAGASIPLTRKLMNMYKKASGNKLYEDTSVLNNEFNRKVLTRNMVGLATLAGAYQYREAYGDDEGDYKLLTFGDERMDTTPQFPLRQYLWAGEAVRRIKNGTFGDWYDHREATQTFLGTNVRVGTANVIIEDIISLVGAEDSVTGEDLSKTAFAALGNYLSTFVTPMNQVIEIQRATGNRGMDYMDAAEDPTLKASDNYFSEFTRPFRARGYNTLFNPASEADGPEREFTFSSDKRRSRPLLKATLGINLFKKDDDHGQFFKELGYTEFGLSSRSKIPSIRRAENNLIREQLPIVADVMQDLKEMYEIDYDNLVEAGEDMGDITKVKFTTDLIKTEINKIFSEIKTSVKEGGKALTKQEALLYDEHRRIPSQIRKTSMTRFRLLEGRKADTSSMDDIRKIIAIAKQERK